MNRAFWRGKRVFLTGHTGFKGGWLSLWLAELGAEVHGYALAPPTEPNFFTVCRHAAAPGQQHHRRHPRCRRTRPRPLQAARPEIVLHLAAQPLVRYSYAAPVETYAVNVMGTVNLLEAVRQTPGVTAVVNVTTDKCYENREWVWPYRENEAMGGYDPYSSSKACAELVTAAYRQLLPGRQPAYSWPARAPAMSSAAATGPTIAWSPIFCVRSMPARHLTIRSPRRHPPLAACARAAVRLSDAGGETLHGRPRLCRGVEFRPRRGGRQTGAVDRRIPVQPAARRTWQCDERAAAARGNMSCGWTVPRPGPGSGGTRAGTCRPRST